MSKDKKKYKFNPITNEKYIFEDLPVRSQRGIKDMKHECLICGKHVSNEEATQSSILIRKLFPISNDSSPYLWDVWVMDFCAPCADTFKTKEDFIDFVKEQNDEKEKKSS